MFENIRKILGVNKEQAENVLETERLYLRHIHESDAEVMYELAKDPDVGMNAGWFPHKSIEDTLEFINSVKDEPNIFAIISKSENKFIGCIELKPWQRSVLKLPEHEGELGYWLGKDYWGRGIVPEAAKEIMHYGFEKLRLEKIWAGYFEGNDNSKRVQEKLGFKVVTTMMFPDAVGEERETFVTCITKGEWLTLNEK